MPTTDITFVDFNHTHIDGALALSRQADWPHRREDWEMMLSLSHGFAAIELDRVVGTTLFTPFGANAGSVNMVIVEEKMRGRGLGRKLMELALAAGQERELRLTATEDGLPLYERLGFVRTGVIRQHQGNAPAFPLSDDAEYASAADLPEIVALDRNACGMDRTGLFVTLSALGKIAILRRQGRIEAFAALRPFGRGDVIGPIVAANSKDARTLIVFHLALRPGKFVRVDVPEFSGLGDWLTEHALAHAGGGISMARGGNTRPASDFHTYALASQALG